MLPLISANTRPYYSALAEHRIELQYCGGCDRYLNPPAPVCPYCQSTDLRWDEVSGEGTVHSWIRYHRAFAPAFVDLLPYVVLIVRLDAGPFFFGRLASDMEPAIGMRVEAILEAWNDGGLVPAFVPRSEEPS